MSFVKSGAVLGAGAAVNVSIGFIPDWVVAFNATDGTPIVTWFRYKTLMFDSGSEEVVPGMVIVGNTSGATAVVKRVDITSGTLANGDLAGTFMVEDATVTGTWENDETINIRAAAYTEAKTNVATANLALGNNCITTAAAAASATADTGILAYVGTDELSPGFTLGVTLAASAKVIRWTAGRDRDS